MAMSRRQVGTIAATTVRVARRRRARSGRERDDDLFAAAAASVSTPTRASSARCSSALSSVPSSRLTRAGRNVTRDGAGLVGRGVDATRGDLAARPLGEQLGGAVRADARQPRLLALLEPASASERSASRCAVRRMLTGSKIAALDDDVGGPVRDLGRRRRP